MRRRTFLGGLGATALCTVLASPALASGGLAAVPRPRFQGDSLPAAHRIARHYLARHPGQASRPALLHGLGCAADAGWESVGAALGPARQADFRAGRTLVVDGWLVAEAEARVCVLMVLEGGGAC